jgi:uncharacterized protein
MKGGRVILNAPPPGIIHSRDSRNGGLRIIRPTLALLCALLFSALGVHARAAEVIPPAPRDHFNDYAGIVNRGTAQQLEAELTQFERDTSNQLLVVIYPRLQSDSSVEDYTVRVAQAWRVGQKERKNGAVLFIFTESHDIRVQVGYGLEGALPDALCKQIIENEIVPRFRANDFTGGVAAGTHALMAATRGEYQGTGRVVANRNVRGGGNGFSFIALVIFIVVISILRSFGRRNVIYSRRGRFSPWISTGGWGGGGWGGGGGGGGGSFSGGGGSFGGGGAGGKW